MITELSVPCEDCDCEASLMCTECGNALCEDCADDHGCEDETCTHAPGDDCAVCTSRPPGCESPDTPAKLCSCPPCATARIVWQRPTI